MKDFSSLEDLFGALAAVGCVDNRLLSFFKPDSLLLEGCLPYYEDIDKTNREIVSIQASIEADASKLEDLPRTPTAIESPESYKWPASYERDKWIYENIPEHSFSDTVTALEKLAIKKNWDLVTSRNGLKKVAKRYADFHNFASVKFCSSR